MNKVRTIETLTIDSSILCCNFVNTVYAWRGENLHEYLGTYPDFIAWCKKLRVSNDDYLNSLLDEASQHPQKAISALQEIKEVRQLLYLFISAIADGKQDDYNVLLAKLNPLITNALSHIELNFSNEHFGYVFIKDPADLKNPLYAILKSLYDLLTLYDLNRIKECPKCGWVFLDETKNGKRRWCNPTDCGTQDKMKRYTAKKKQ